MRILLVSYYFPPFNSVGAVRTGKLARFLWQQGHQVHVLTCSNPPLPEGLPLEIPAERVTAVPEWSVNAPVEWLRGGRARVAREGFGATTASASMKGRLGHLYKTLLHWPDGHLGWVGAAMAAGRSLLRVQRYDLLYASGSPFSDFRVAARLARESGLPWVAEFRDLWTDNHAYAYPNWKLALERHWERRLIASADALVTVSEPLARTLGRFGKPVWEIRNGCDPEDFEGLQPPAGFEAGAAGLDIAFTGNVYDTHYDVDTFCAGLARYVAQGGNVRVHVAGRNIAAMQQAAQRHGVVQHFRFQGMVPRRQALAMQRHADVLLAFLWQGERHEGVYSTKLFEYAGAERPVLAIGQRTDTGALIEAAGLGRVCADAGSVAQALDRLRAEKLAHGRLATSASAGHDFTRLSQFLQLESRLLGMLGA